MFWIVARTCFTLYRWFPLFGKLRASIAVIHRDGKFLAIQRNDGRGISLPGGISQRRRCPLRHFSLRSAGQRRAEEFLGRLAAMDDRGRTRAPPADKSAAGSGMALENVGQLAVGNWTHTNMRIQDAEEDKD